jgi:hypothetical protein
MEQEIHIIIQYNLATGNIDLDQILLKQHPARAESFKEVG